ncbi:MAG: PAS domain S-box protein [Acidobacteria bacterium]|nr:PAS domain S-box protein [Acidobacteriota bacterium]
MLILTIGIILLGLVNTNERLNQKPIPDDGVLWVDTSEGIKADLVRTGSAADRAGIVRDDLLRWVSFDEGKNYYKIESTRDIFFILDEKVLPEGSITYTIERKIAGEIGLWDADLNKIESEPSRLPLQIYLAIVGSIFLLVGLYVLAKQNGAPYVMHFYIICLLSFTSYCLSMSGSFSTADKIVFLADTSAFLLLAPLLFHFCLNFPFRRKLVTEKQWLISLVYIPSLILIFFRFIIMFGSQYNMALLSWEHWIKKIETLHFTIFLLVSSALLLITFLQTRASILRQQLKWIVWGLSLNAIPFAIFYAYPYLLGKEISPLQQAFATGASILLPISFGYSIVRYRLMDVDIILRRSMTYVLATVSVVVIFMLGVVKAGQWVHELVPSISQNATVALQVAVMSLAAMLFAPIKNWLQERVDRLFFGERYDNRHGIADFGRTLSSTTEMTELLSSLANRLGEMLYVNQLAIFIEEETSNKFRLAYSANLPIDPVLSSEIIKLALDSKYNRRYVLAEQVPGLEDSNRRLLDYYVPCYLRDRLIAIIGLGKTIEGSILTSEDIELVKSLSGYVAVAIENSLLYRSEKEKAFALAKLKDFSENIIESVNVGLLSIDKEGFITNWNRTLEELLAIRRSDALGSSVEEIFDKDLITTIHNATGNFSWQLDSTHNIYHYKTTSRNGRELVFNLSLSPLETKDARLSGTLILLEDITERVRLEEQLRATDKLSSIGLLAAGVAHEVNTPLTGISSYTQMLLAQTPSIDPKHLVLEKIKRQTHRASEIVNNLLNFSRTGNVEFAELDIHRVLDDTIQLLEPQLRNTQIKLERAYGEALPSTIGNATKLQQVFMNLLINARDAMPQGGTLSIHTQYRDGAILIEIQDTGVGIAPENIAKIYDPFFTTKGVGQGTGLGLAVSYGIIQEHKGRIFVESKPGQGTQFQIKLPASTRLQLAGD